MIRFLSYRGYDFDSINSLLSALKKGTTDVVPLIKEIPLEESENELNYLLKEKEIAISEHNLSRAKALKKRQTEIEKSISKQKKKVTQNKAESTKILVEYEDIAEVVTDWTGVPVSKLIEAESDKLLSLEESLKELDRRIPEEYDKVYWHGLWRRKQK